MKRLILFLGLVLLSKASYSQVAENLKFTYARRQVSDTSSLLMLESVARIANISSNQNYQVKVSRTLVSEVTGSENYFCWDVCYDSPTSVSTGALTIAAGDTNSIFSAHYKPMGSNGITSIKYCFFNSNDVSDSICYNATYISGITNIESIYQSIGINLFPNPTHGELNISSEGLLGESQRFKILNSQGKLIFQGKVKAKVQIDLSNYSQGIYFLQLFEDDMLIKTEKFIVE